MRRFLFVLTIAVVIAVPTFGGSGPNGVDILPFPSAMPGGGGDGSGVDILPLADPNSIGRSYSSPPPGSSFALGSCGRGLMITVGPTVTDPGTGEPTTTVTVSGCVSAWGGEAVDSVAADVPVGDFCSFDVDLHKRGKGEADPDAKALANERDPNVVKLHIDVPWAELEDGNPLDDPAGWAEGFNPYCGWGRGEVTG